MDNFYLYCHYFESFNQPFYIGKGKHQGECYSKKYARAVGIHFNGDWKNYVSKFDIKWNHKILFDNLTHNEVNELERKYIKKYGRIDNGTGILINQTDGAGGSTGRIIKQETKNKISMANSGENNGMFGKKNSIETLNKKSSSMKGKNIGKICLEETKEKIKNTLKKTYDKKGRKSKEEKNKHKNQYYRYKRLLKKNQEMNGETDSTNTTN